MFDVAVIGAGPAGAWAAYTLARRGARVVVVDPSHPREKPCGGGVTGRALAVTAGAIDAARLPMRQIRAARFFESGNGESRSARVQLTCAPASAAQDANERQSLPALTVASRSAFDAALVAAAVGAGARHLSARVRGIAPTARGFQIDTSAGPIDAARLVGADGANSFVRRKLLRPFRRDQLSIATGCFAHGATDDEIVIEFVGSPPGYIWSFPRPDHLAIGICAPAGAGVGADALRARVLDWIRATGVGKDARLQPYSWPIPSLSARDLDRLEVAGRGWYLAGDAAGLVDPITREGIYFALVSAAWAADAAASGDARAAARYAERVREEIGSELRRAARLQAGFFRPRFTRLLMTALLESAAIREVMADLIAGRQPYRGLKWRLLRTGELSLAWRAITERNSRPAL